MCFIAIAATREESKPPESKTPQGTSDIMQLTTDRSRAYESIDRAIHTSLKTTRSSCS